MLYCDTKVISLSIKSIPPKKKVEIFLDNIILVLLLGMTKKKRNIPAEHRILLRLPLHMAKGLKIRAKQMGRSVNGQIVYELAQSLTP